MSDQKKQQKDEHDVDEDELEQQKGEELPDREVMSIIDPATGAPTGGLGPPVLGSTPSASGEPRAHERGALPRPPTSRSTRRTVRSSPSPAPPRSAATTSRSAGRRARTTRAI